jgi:hypothetical protein
MSRSIKVALLAALAAAAGLALGACSGAGGAAAPEASLGGVTAPLMVTSDDFADGGGLASTFAAGDGRCPGDNLNPQLTWSEGPAGTASYAIALNDPDARGYSHWLHVDIPADIKTVARGGSASLPGVAGRGTNGTAAYYGPCPPSQHHYVFTVYALDALLAPDHSLTWAEFAEAADGHVLAVGSITGLFPAP